MKITLLTGRTFDIQEQLGFEIKVVRSAQAKRLTLRIDEKARIPVLTIPPPLPDQKSRRLCKRPSRLDNQYAGQNPCQSKLCRRRRHQHYGKKIHRQPPAQTPRGSVHRTKTADCLRRQRIYAPPGHRFSEKNRPCPPVGTFTPKSGVNLTGLSTA